MKDHLKALNIQ